jgi:hypothetical protein
MSRGQIPRTPEHFPAMKYRARKRKTRWWLPPWVTDPVGWDAALNAFLQRTASVNRIGDAARESAAP